MSNAKNDIKELIETFGLSQQVAVYTHEPAGRGWRSTLVLQLPLREAVTGVGAGARASEADMAAARAVKDQLDASLFQAWPAIRIEAQAGDALLKIAAYLASGPATAADRSCWLQAVESDPALAVVYDRWAAEGAPELAAYGPGLGEKAKAALVEAVLWRRYGARVLGPEAALALAELRGSLTSQ